MKQGWKTMTIGDVADITDYVANGSFASLRENVSYKKERDYAILVRLADFSNGFDESKFIYIDKHSYDFLAKSSLFGGEIIMSNVGSVGKLFICPDLGMPMSLAPNSIVIRTAYNKFYYYLLQSSHYQHQIMGITSTTALPKFNKTSFKKIPVSVPPLEEQKQIVSQFDLLQSIIDKQQAQLKELDNLAQAVFYDMFGDPVENEKEFETAELNAVCDVRDGTHDSPSYYEEGCPLITSKNVVDGKISFEEVNYICKEDFDNISKRSRVDDGDIIMPMIGTIGKPTIVKKDREFAIKNVALIKFLPNSKVLNIFIQAIMSSKAFDTYMKSKNKGGTQKFIALGDIRRLKVQVPPMDLQLSFAEKIDSIEKQKAAISKSIEETQKLFDYTMDKYFG